MIHILLPAYNEEQALAPVLEGIARTLADGNYRVWVVDDGSQDGTAAVAEKWAALIPLTLVRHPRNAGLGKAFQTGLAHILPAMKGSDVLVTLDADNTHPAQLIPRLAHPLEEGRADLSIASRFAPGGETVGVPWFRRFTSQGARLLFRFLFPIPFVRDYTCGFRAYRGDLLQKGQDRWKNLVTENGFASAVEWLIKLSRLSPRVVEVPLVLRYDRKPTPSKMPVARTILKTVALILRLKKIR
jgi:dolichol-phosphate mannosyltransferase